ncbi:unnamed protein product [Darwinula stevensoni]|uniref:AIG1-type G domain-containing protein n=1 Tax=Darwinula stevensoni TaxID=69355 RepID=A0A7R8X621_9CRUS|nr:unnamed protein product [Darwinula stevensoni]CAG0887656.1 unnamed protein product [Darwinula stevensoni]
MAEQFIHQQEDPYGRASLNRPMEDYRLSQQSNIHTPQGPPGILQMSPFPHEERNAELLLSLHQNQDINLNRRNELKPYPGQHHSDSRGNLQGRNPPGMSMGQADQEPNQGHQVFSTPMEEKMASSHIQQQIAGSPSPAYAQNMHPRVPNLQMKPTYASDLGTSLQGQYNEYVTFHREAPAPLLGSSISNKGQYEPTYNVQQQRGQQFERSIQSISQPWSGNFPQNFQSETGITDDNTPHHMPYMSSTPLNNKPGTINNFQPHQAAPLQHIPHNISRGHFGSQATNNWDQIHQQHQMPIPHEETQQKNLPHQLPFELQQPQLSRNPRQFQMPNHKLQPLPQQNPFPHQLPVQHQESPLSHNVSQFQMRTQYPQMPQPEYCFPQQFLPQRQEQSTLPPTPSQYQIPPSQQRQQWQSQMYSPHLLPDQQLHQAPPRTYNMPQLETWASTQNQNQSMQNYNPSTTRYISNPGPVITNPQDPPIHPFNQLGYRDQGSYYSYRIPEQWSQVQSSGRNLFPPFGFQGFDYGAAPFAASSSDIPPNQSYSPMLEAVLKQFMQAMPKSGTGAEADIKQNDEMEIRNAVVLPKEEELTPAQKMRKKCKLIEGNVYMLPMKRIMQDEENHLAKYEVGRRRPENGPGKVLMVVGATGAGKSTLINGIANYAYGVKFEDDFRFKLIVDEEKKKSQAHSQTKWITAYVLQKQRGFILPNSLTVIDTPGFGDTEGIKADEELRNQIREFFSKGGAIGVDQLDAICFVVQASSARLTHTQKYIFDSILSVFGRDVQDNIYVLATFADNKKPPVLEAIAAADIPFKTHFKFNNSALFSGDHSQESEEFDKTYWEMGVSSFKKFFRKFQDTKPVSLTLTKEVLKERQRLETALQGIQPQITAGLGRLEQLRQEHAALRQHEAELQANKEFTYTVKVQKQTRVDLEIGVYVTNCLRCNFSCHFPCTIPQDDMKDNCDAMGVNTETGLVTHCLVCPGNCPPNQHVNNQYRFELFEEEETKTSDELKAKYEEAAGKKLTTEGIVKELIKGFNQERANILNLTKRAHECLQRLDDIALKPDPLAVTDYIDLLIQTEQREAKPGHLQRIKYLQDTRAKAKLAETLKKDFDPFEEYMKEFEEEGFNICLFDPDPIADELGYSIGPIVEEADKEEEKPGVFKKCINLLETKLGFGDKSKDEKKKKKTGKGIKPQDETWR